VKVIYDPEDPHADLYDVDDASTIITLADWYHRFAPDLQAEYLSPNNTFSSEQLPDCGTINGGTSSLPQYPPSQDNH